MITKVNVGGVEADILGDGYRKGDDTTGRGAWRQIRYRVDWDQSDLFVEKLKAYDTVDVHGTVYQIPHPYPGNPALRFMRAEVEGLGRVRPDLTTDDPLYNKLIAYEHAIVDCYYGQHPFVIDPNIDDPGGLNNLSGLPFRGARISYGMRTYQIPETALIWDDDESDALGATSFTLTVPQIIYTYSWRNFPGIPHHILAGIMGALNDDEFWGQPRGTIMASGGNSGSGFSPGQGIDQDVDFSLIWQWFDHNADFDPDSGQPRVMKTRSGMYPHRYVDFSVLL